MKKSIKYGITVGLLSFALVGCGDKVYTYEPSDYVENNDEMIINYVNNFIEFGDKHVKIYDYVNENPTSYSNIESMALDFMEYIESHDPDYYGEIAEDTYHSYNNALISSQLAMENYVEYAVTRDESFLELAEEYHKDVKEEVGKVIEAMKPHLE